MTKRPIAIALTLALSFGLSACSKSETAEGGTHHAEHKHIAASDGDAARGEKLASTKLPSGQACVDCHGAGGAKSNESTTPTLAGQYPDYLFHALQQYRDGGRDHAVMSMHIKGASDAGVLDDQGFADLAAYFAAQPGSLGDLHNQ